AIRGLAPRRGAVQSCGIRTAFGQARESLGRRASPGCSSETRDHLREFRETLLHRILGSIELGLGARIVASPRVEDGHEIGHSLAILRHGAEIALRHHAPHMILWPCLDPYRVRAA